MPTSAIDPAVLAVVEAETTIRQINGDMINITSCVIIIYIFLFTRFHGICWWFCCLTYRSQHDLCAHHPINMPDVNLYRTSLWPRMKRCIITGCSSRHSHVFCNTHRNFNRKSLHLLYRPELSYILSLALFFLLFFCHPFYSVIPSFITPSFLSFTLKLGCILLKIRRYKRHQQ